MHFTTIARAVGAAALLAGSWAAQATDATTAAPSDIGACTKKSFGSSMMRDIGLKSTDREGAVKNIKLRMFMKPKASGANLFNLRVVEPSGLAGTGYLVVEDARADEAVYLYVPLFQSVVEVKGSEMTQPLWGTGISYAELKAIQGLLLSRSASRKPDAKIGERPVFVLETAADMETDGYRRILSQIDQQTCVLLKAEFFAKGDQPAKMLEADPASIRSNGQVSFASKVVVKNLRDGMSTEVTLGDPTIKDLPDLLFDPANFFSMEP